MNDNEGDLLDNYTRSREFIGQILIEVAEICWPGPSEPVASWRTVLEIPLDSKDKNIMSARIKALRRMNILEDVKSVVN